MRRDRTASRTRRCLLAAWASLLGAGAARAEDVPDDVPTIPVLGRRAEAESLDRPGQTLVIRPEDATRFDTAAQLRRDASLAVPETGRINAAGFAVPSVRGQDPRLTEVYVEDLLVQDPYSGLPLVDELDLRAFGELVVTVGVPPPELPAVDPVGLLQYRLRPLKEDQVLTGLDAGRPYGAAVWTLAGTQSGKGGWQARLYARAHATDGRFQYYDDNGTPYNSADDSFRTRDGNGRRSFQAMPVVSGVIAGGVASALALVERSSTQIPGLGPTRDQHADETSTSALATARWESPGGTSLRLGGNDQWRKTADPGHQILGPRGNTALRVTSGRIGVEQRLGGERATVRVGAEGTAGDIRAGGEDSAADLRATRRVATVYASAAVRPLPPFLVEAKALGRRLDDRTSGAAATDALTTSAPGKRSLVVDGETVAASWSFAGMAPYAQLGRVGRAPTLLEEFGDGGLVRASTDVKPERGLHREAGLSWRAADGTWRTDAAAFEDDTTDRILLLPSLARSVRAQNVGHARVRGFELRGDATLGGTHVLAGGSRLTPEDLTDPAHVHVLPLVAERQAVLGIDQRLGPLTLRWDSRYSSQIYRDQLDTVVVPAAWIHDLAVDGRWRPFGRALDAGVSVLNVADVRKLPVAAPGPGGNSGETAYGDVAGDPLPGRQWRVSVAVTF